jgi:hypothetical protein
MSLMLREVTWCNYKISMLLIHFVHNVSHVLAVVAWEKVGAQVVIVRWLFSYLIVTNTFWIHTLTVIFVIFKYMTSKVSFLPKPWLIIGNQKLRNTCMRNVSNLL